MSDNVSTLPGEQNSPEGTALPATGLTATLTMKLARWRREARRTSGWAGLLYVIPALIILLLFEVWPIFYNVWISLWRWDIGPIRFVGLGNYARLFGEGFITRDYNDQLAVGEVLHSLIVTIYYVLGRVPITIVLAFILAYLLFQGVQRGKALLRTAYFLPYVTSSIAVSTVFIWIFHERVGIANALMQAMGLPRQSWLQDPIPFMKRIGEWSGAGLLESWPNLAAGPSTALLVVILYSIWTALGYNIVIYLAGLTGIPNEVLEAARIDGAGSWTLVRSVVWPLVTPTTFFLLIANTISSFQAFDPIFALTRNVGMGRGEAGGPLNTTLTITVYIFRNFYEKSNSVGYAAAVALFLFLLILGLTIAQFRLFSRRVHYQ
jgi:multiple sugar transport system permease protein